VIVESVQPRVQEPDNKEDIDAHKNSVDYQFD